MFTRCKKHGHVRRAVHGFTRQSVGWRARCSFCHAVRNIRVSKKHGHAALKPRLRAAKKHGHAPRNMVCAASKKHISAGEENMVMRR
jgi:hypothetical protein